MSYIRDFTSVTVNQNSFIVQINAGDSNFSIKENSQLFIEGYTVPVTVLESDSNARTLTLTKPWPHANVNGVAARVVPLGDPDTYLTAVEANRAAYEAFVEAAAGSGSPDEINWSIIIDPPVTATQWPTWVQVQGDINDVLPETATRFPTFPEIGGKVSVEQLPDDIDTDNKRTRALSPPVRQNPSLTHILSDYPTLKKTVDIPTHSPNNRREMLFDDVRQTAYIALTEDWLKVPNVIATREFLVKPDNTRLYFNSNYTGQLTLRVYPMGAGGTGLPNSPSLTNFEWHTVTSAVTDLGQFASGFVGIIDYIETDNGFEVLSSGKSHFLSVGIYHGNSDGSAAINRFKQFSLRQDGFWYSSDVLPETPYSMGGSWSQDAEDFRQFSVVGADDGNDALRLFGDDWDDYKFEIVVVTDIPNPMALTISNTSEVTTFFQGTYRFIIEQDRIYFKRQASFAPITGTVRIESLRLRVNHYE